jgi:alpha-amylase/alpha-mannosidase (GH57 family)
MNKPLNICFSLHNHQPHGNFHEIFKEATKLSYLPFLKLLQKNEKIKTTIHYSGSLLEWFSKNKPEIMELIKELIEKNQLELLTSGFYDPILTMIPPEDRIGQIEYMNEKLNNWFGIEPNGMWIPERVWEPEICDALGATNITYALLDDSHINNSGYSSERLTDFRLVAKSTPTLVVFDFVYLVSLVW